MGTQKWKVKGFPTPDVYLGQNQRPGKVSKNTLVALKGIQVKYSPDFPISANPNFRKCKYEIIRNGNFIKTGVLTNGKFNNSDLTFISNSLRKGDLIYFNEIDVLDPSGNKPKIPEYMMKID